MITSNSIVSKAISFNSDTPSQLKSIVRSELQSLIHEVAEASDRIMVNAERLINQARKYAGRNDAEKMYTFARNAQAELDNITSKITFMVSRL